MDELSLNSLTLDRHLALAGSPAASFARLWQTLWVQPYLTPAQLELCRLTLARLHGDEAERTAVNPHLAPGTLSAAQREGALSGTAAAAGFAASERALLEFTECYAIDPQGIPDAVADEVVRHLGESGLVFLIEALGCIDARIRTARCLRDLAHPATPAGAQ